MCMPVHGTCNYYSERECEEGDIRLVNDSDGHGREFMLTGSDSSSVEEGRVEMCQNEVWGTFCDRSWGTIDAKVVCRQLNLSTDCEYWRTTCTIFKMNIIYLYLDTRALIKYEGGSGPIHYTSISCTGSETHLVNCYKRYYFSRSCLNKYAGASCPSGEQLLYTLHTCSCIITINFLIFAITRT